MNNSPNIRVGRIFAYACECYKDPKRTLSDEDCKAMKRQITRHLKKERKMSAPYLVTDREMREIVKGDLRDYFEERLGNEEAVKAVTERKQLRKKVAELREIATEEICNSNSEVYEDFYKYGPVPYVSDEITSDEFQQLMIRAMFRKMFPTFDEARFKAEYEEWHYLSNEWASWPPNLDDDQVIRLSQLKKRILPALANGDISAYEHNEDTRQETVKSHG